MSYTHDEKEKVIVGKINFTDWINEEKIGMINFNKRDYGECTIHIYPNEGPIPHFHVVSKKGDFDCCIRIYEANFFDHGYHGKPLGKKQCKELNEWLKKPNRKIKNMSNWEYIKDLWEDYELDKDYKYKNKVDKQPDYSEMRYFRS